MFRLDVNKPDCPATTGVTRHIPDRCHNGYTLYWSRGNESAQLIDISGRVVHQWSYPQGIGWHWAKMLDDGHLLVIPNTGGYGPKRNTNNCIIELDWDSTLVWHDAAHAHHDAWRQANGNTLVVCHAQGVYPAVSPRPLLYDYVQEITPDNKVVWSWHIAAHVDELAALVEVVRCDWQGDWPHLNTVEELPDTPLGRRDERFRAGNVLMSPRALHCVFVVDKDTGQIVWAWGPGEILGQHQPTMLPNGNILLFDNGNGNGPKELRGWSRVVEIDPPTGEIVWQYKADPPESFWTPVGSGQQRLANGNTMICAMNWAQTGRVFEVTPAGEIVWEFWNPEPLSIYRAYRYDAGLIEPLLAR